ncbi:acetyl-CoA carboxylase biotin carboxylase subunit, partial [Micromonospora sp. NPDC049580]
DSLLAKVIVWAPDRELALNRLERALEEFDIAGPGMHTTIGFVRRVLDDAAFRKGRYTTGLVDRLLAASPPVPAQRPTATPTPRAAPAAEPDVSNRRTR